MGYVFRKKTFTALSIFHRFLNPSGKQWKTNTEYVLYIYVYVYGYSDPPPQDLPNSFFPWYIYRCIKLEITVHTRTGCIFCWIPWFSTNRHLPDEVPVLHAIPRPLGFYENGTNQPGDESENLLLNLWIHRIHVWLITFVYIPKKTNQM